MLLVKTYIAASSIEGVGVFAADPIDRGSLIWRFEPRFDHLISKEDYRAFSRSFQDLLDRYAYPSPGEVGYLVFEADNGRFMNHSEAPNTDFSQFGGGTARRDISAGEELTCDYREFYQDFALHPREALAS